MDGFARGDKRRSPSSADCSFDGRQDDHAARLRPVSTADQGLEAQGRRLREAGVFRLFEDVISGRTFERQGLQALLDLADPCASCWKPSTSSKLAASG